MTKKHDDIQAVRPSGTAGGQTMRAPVDPENRPDPAAERAEVKALDDLSVREAGARQKDLQHATTVRDLTARIKELEDQVLTLKSNRAQFVDGDKSLIRAVGEAIHRHHAISGDCADGACARDVLEALMK